MTEYFDTLEIRDPEQRERALLAQLPRQIAYAKAHAPAYARLLADVDPAAITSREALERCRWCANRNCSSCRRSIARSGASPPRAGVRTRRGRRGRSPRRGRVATRR